MNARRAILLGILAGLAAVLVWLAAAPPWNPATPGTPAPAATTAARGEPYPGNPEQEARLVQAEYERLVYVRAVSSAARWRVDDLTGPYRLRTARMLTLVLPARPEPYTVADLLTLAPQTFVRQKDRSFLLSENVVVLAGATLALESSAPLTLRLKSDADAFVSIVTLGGSLRLAGSVEHPVTVSSWDARAGALDTDTADGRSYLRVVGGNASLSNVRLSGLGFWSGDTGGLSLTGAHPLGDFDATDEATVPDPSVGGARLIPPGALTGPADAAEDYGFVSAAIDNVAATGNAFGLFVSSARGVTIRDTRISNSLVNGLVFHRYVSDAYVTRTESSDNAVDGISLARSSTGVVFDTVSALRNGRDGISLDGQALAGGPNATGTPVESYGDNRVTESTIADNARYGVEISGGRDLAVTSSRIEGNETGIMVNHGTEGVVIADNVLRGQRRQAIAIRDAVVDALLRWNSISGADTGIHVRNASAVIQSNRIGAVSNHAVSLVGDVRDVNVTGNAIGGHGAVAIWTEQATGGTIVKNDMRGWHPATTFPGVIRSLFQPLTIVWMLLGLLLVATALTRRGPQFGSFRNPYAEHVPLTSLSKGIVSRDSLDRSR